MTLPTTLNEFLFGIYPYICLTVLLLGSLVRYDREPYSWKSDSSQILRARTLRWGSNLFHYGVLVVVLGHFAGFLIPEWAIGWLLEPAQHQLLAMVGGGRHRRRRRLRGGGEGQWQQPDRHQPGDGGARERPPAERSPSHGVLCSVGSRGGRDGPAVGGEAPTLRAN